MYERRLLIVNGDTSKVSRCLRNDDSNGIRFSLNRDLLQEVQCFKCQVSQVKKTGHITTELKRKV